MTKFTLADAGTVRRFAESHVDESWDPVEFGNEDRIGDIVMDARNEGVITCPPGAEVDFDYSADNDGGGFQFLIRLTRDTTGGPRTITLSSPFNEMRNVVSRCGEVTGPAAITEILEAAVIEANAVVMDLDWYMAGETRALVEPTLATEVAAVLSQALADADAEIRRVHGDRDYDEEDVEYAVQWRDRVNAASAAFEAAVGRQNGVDHAQESLSVAPDRWEVTYTLDGEEDSIQVTAKDEHGARYYAQKNFGSPIDIVSVQKIHSKD